MRMTAVPPGSSGRSTAYSSEPSWCGSEINLEVRGQAGAGGVLDVRRRLGVRVPRLPVAPVVELLREARDLQRVKRVAHDGELVSLVQADALLRQPRLRPVWEPGRMQRDRSHLDALARAEVAGDVI